MLYQSYSSPHLNMLAVATEWDPHNGGLSSLNRNLCLALAQAGHRVVCLVPTASRDEVAMAAKGRVELVEATATKGKNVGPLACLHRKPVLPKNFAPDIVLGHGRVTGFAAQTLVQDFFPRALRIHLLHTVPSEIEWYKPRSSDAAVRAEGDERVEIELGRTAALAVGVGPRLAAELANLLAPFDLPRPVHQMNPGLECLAGGPIERRSPRTPPPGMRCLFLGRAEDETLKGLDIAADAIALVRARGTPAVLVVRGAQPGTGQMLQKALNARVGVLNSVRVKEFSADSQTIQQDLLRSTIMLMPSRAEGFGLVGLEAIECGIPTLVSDQSGLAQLLRSRDLPEFVNRQVVVPVTTDPKATANEWAQRIDLELHDPAAAFRRASEVRAAVAECFTWDRTIRLLVDAIARDYPKDSANSMEKATHPVDGALTMGSSIVGDTAGSFALTQAPLLAPGKKVTPPLLRGITFPKRGQGPVNFKVNPGESELTPEALRTTADELVSYFYTALALEAENVYVNLSAYETDRMISPEMSGTTMGRNLLSQDCVLKQLTASFMHPESGLGKEYWDRVYGESRSVLGHSKWPFRTFQKVMIKPLKADIFEQDGDSPDPEYEGTPIAPLAGHYFLYMVNGELEVECHPDTIARAHCANPPGGDLSSRQDVVDEICASAFRDILLPRIREEVNQGEHFAEIRRMFYAQALAVKVKRLDVHLRSNFKRFINTNRPLEISHVITGIGARKKMGYWEVGGWRRKAVDRMQKVDSAIDPLGIPENAEFHAQYMHLFREGLFRCTRDEEGDAPGERIVRVYFSGSIDFSSSPESVKELLTTAANQET